MSQGVLARGMICMLITVSTIGGSAIATSAQNLRRIVTFQGIDLTTPLGYETALAVITASMSSVVHDLSFINALAIQLPADGTSKALDILKSSLCGPIKCVQNIADDTLGMVDGGSQPVCIVPASSPVPESDTWGMQQIGVPAVHSQWQGTGVQVAILDTGIKEDHSELAPRITEGYNARAGEDPSNYQDDNGHGTHMAGIIAADLKAPPSGVSGIIGVAPEVTFLAVKVLDRYGAGYLADLLKGLGWVYDYKNANSGVPLVVNMSLAFSTDIPPLKQAIQKLYSSKVIMVASAGNRCAQSPDQDEGGGDTCQGGPAPACDPSKTAVKYPAAYKSWVIAVVATTSDDLLADYNLSGAAVAVAAPGGSKAAGMRILSSTKGTPNSYGWGSGSSQAAAHVAGAVALALQLDSGLSFQDLLKALQNTATPLIDPSTGEPYPKDKQGAGRINVDDMVQELLP